MTDTVTPIEIPPETTESKNYRRIEDCLSESCAILRLIEDRDGEGQSNAVVYYTHYEIAAGAVRRMLDALREEIDCMDTAAGRAQS